ncbi:MAG: biotin synthase BioB [Geobacteraceae bacterium]|nr:biotin synthase BioB [Geobacteraceae bacterium]
MAILQDIIERLENGGTPSAEDLSLLEAASGSELFELFAAANKLREKHAGNRVHLCSIVNAKSGRCPENCAFCAQSVHHETNAPVYPLLDPQEIAAKAVNAEKAGSECFGIVASGSSIGKGQELDRICDALRSIRSSTKVPPSCSLGTIDMETAVRLKEAGAVTYHHNLETSRSFFPSICTTHDYDEDVETVRNAKKAGLRVCCGGIFGLGETMEQRIELALTLRELDVDSIPINFLNPIPGTRLADADFLTPMTCLSIIAVFRLILPDKKITVCGGREKNLRDLQSWIFFAGASGMMIGNYLTTTGRDEEQDRQMLGDLGMVIEPCAC